MVSTSPKATRKQVTVLFCDVANYTSRSIEVDMEELSGEILNLQVLCETIVTKYQGHISSYLGDGIMALFGHPESNEFSAINAAYAALDIVNEIKKDNHFNKTNNQKTIDIRIGIATSLAMVGERAGKNRDQDELIFGEAPNLAARLQAIAQPNTVVTSARTRKLIGNIFVLEHLGEFNLKGFKQNVPVWQIIKKNTTIKQRPNILERNLIPFVSRQQETSFLTYCYQQVVQNSSIFVHVSGEAGVGKSRLIHHFLDNLIEDEILKLHISCSPYYESTAFHPLIETYRSWADFRQEDSNQDKLRKIKKLLTDYDLSDKEDFILLCEFLTVDYSSEQINTAISAEEKYLKTIELLIKLLISLSRKKPLIVIAEDLHWADASTIKFFDYALTHINKQRILVIQTSRHEFNIPWKQSDSFIKLALRGLSDRDSATIIRSVFASIELPKKTEQELVEKSQGIPLYLEECSWDMLNQIYTEHSQNNQDNFSVPDSLQDALNARLDKLGQAKDLAQLAATFLTDFSYSKIKELAQINTIEVDTNIDILVQSKILKVVSYQNSNQHSYTFRHALFQESAYHSLLIKTRKLYHTQIAELFIKSDKDLIDQQPELLALHYEKSTEPSKAIPLWLRSGRLAIKRAEINDAKNLIKNGLAALKKLTNEIEIKRHEMELRFTLAVCRTLAEGYFGDNVTSDFKRSIELANELEETQHQWPSLYGYWRCLVCQAKFNEAMKTSVILMRLADFSRDRKLTMTSTGIKAFTRMINGNFHKASSYFENSIAYYNSNEDRDMGIHFGQDPYVTIQGLMAVNSLISNDIEKSNQQIQQAVTIARNINHPYTIAETLRLAAVHAQIANDQESLLNLSQEAIEISQKFQFDGLLAASQIFLSYYQVYNHRDDTFISSIEENLERYKEKYGLLFYPYFQGLLAQAHLSIEQYQEAFTMANYACMLCQTHGEQWAILPAIKTKILSALYGNLSDGKEIVEWHKQGIDIATRQRANLYLEQLNTITPLIQEKYRT